MSSTANIIKELKDKVDKINNAEIFINVLIRDKKFRQYCGEGNQKLRWLTDCAIFKYENANDHKVSCGVAYGLKTENGGLCDLNSTIASTLTNGANVMVLLKEEYEVEMDERNRKASNVNNKNVDYLERLNELEENKDNFGSENGEEEEYNSEEDNNNNNEEGEYEDNEEYGEGEEYNN